MTVFSTTYSQNQRVRISFTPEATWGTTPATPSMTLLPVTGFTLNLTRNELKDQAIHADGMPRYSLGGNSNVGGEISFDLAANEGHDLLASAVKGAWVADELKIGTTESSFTFEQFSADTNLGSVFEGVTANTFKISIGNDVVKASVGVIGRSGSFTTTGITGATYSAEDTSIPYTQFAGTFKEGGVACGYLSQLEISGASGSNANFALGDTFAKNAPAGAREVTGTATMYFVSNAIFTKFINGTDTSIEATVTSIDGNTFKITVPRAKYTQVTKTTASTGSVTLSVTFTALYDSATASLVVFNRT